MVRWGETGLCALWLTSILLASLMLVASVDINLFPGAAVLMALVKAALLAVRLVAALALDSVEAKELLANSIDDDCNPTTLNIV